MLRPVRRSSVLWVVLAVIALAVPRTASAHCDTVDGPVAKAGRKALESGTISYALVWVKSEHDVELGAAFERARKVRALDADARELADRYFLETLVRLHRAGEGEPYTGLKPAGEGHTRAIRAADRAVARGSVKDVQKVLAGAMAEGLRERFDAVSKRRRYDVDDVDRGREYVEAYVSFVHYVEGLHRAMGGGGHAAH